MVMVQEQTDPGDENNRDERKGEKRERERRDSTRDRKGKDRARDTDRDSVKSKHRDEDKGREDTGKAVATTAAYTPEFLHALANSRTKAEFDVISGEDAVRFTRRFVREQATDGTAVPAELSASLPPGTAPSAVSHAPSHTSHRSLTDRDPKHEEKHLKRSLPPVVFALPRSASGVAGDAGRRVVDFYMSWRGKTKTHPLRGRARRAGFLDAEFKRVRDVLDGEWKRASRAIKGAVCGDSGENGMEDGFGAVSLVRAPTDPQPLPRLPPMLAQYARDAQQNAEGGLSAPPAARSVSDPLPGPSSYPLPSSFPINQERPPLGTHRGSVDSLTSVTSLPLLGMVRGVPVGNRVPLRVTNPGDRMSMSSSSGSIPEVPTAKPVKSSPLRDGVAFTIPPSDSVEVANARPMHMLQLPGRTVSDSSASSGGSSKSRKSKSSPKEKTPRVKDDDKILIVLLDEKDKINQSEKKVAIPDDGATWHGLERRLSTRSARKPSPPTSTHDSPWLGPLRARIGAGGGAGAGAIVPIKNLLSSMGYITPEAAVLGGTPSPYGSYTSLPAAAYSSPYTSPYAGAALAATAYASPYVSPQVQGSPYQLQLQPPSRPRTPVAYGTTPPMGQPQAPLWSSPGAAYPTTAYTSPAPAGYASPYPPASPGMGYASPYAAASPAGGFPSPAAGYASPAGGYTNLAAGYSSPYVPPLQNGSAAGHGSPGYYYS
ncbi:hypothetical protein MVEN_00890800 [Mycena venus]|uniref:Uncharacterized protein n=1 Tax=Mycena venus TaxID=2733690 RepID=A0A8H7D493_9AGAR|nr:hypothetical protein MVEN_00890800 [Mycena venus]